MEARDIRLLAAKALKGVGIDIHDDLDGVSSARRVAASRPSCATLTDERHQPFGALPEDHARRAGHQLMDMDVVQLRARSEWFPAQSLFSRSIAYGPRIHGLASGWAELDAIVEKSLKRAGSTRSGPD
jgi:phosphate transport system ATP-binding protein